MATNPEAISKLLAISALMNGERDLLRPRDARATATSPPASPEKAAPIATDNKAVTTVLLAMLDEQLHAAEAAAASPLKRPNSAESDVGASKLVAAKYATDGLVRGGDSNLPEPMIAHDLTRTQGMPSVVSADLQSFVQRSVALAAGKLRAPHENSAASRSGTRPVSPVSGWASSLSVAGLAALLLWILAGVVQWLAR